MGLLAAVLHKSASGQLDGAYWDYSTTKNPLGPSIYMRLTFGRRVFEIDVTVCSQRRPRAHCWLLMHHRGSREVWLLSDLKMRQDLNRIALVTPFADGMLPGSVELMACPPELAVQMEIL